MTNALLRKGELLAAFLNESQGIPEQKQVLQLVQMCQTLCSALPKIVPTKWRLGGRQLLDLTKNRAARELLRKINRHLGNLKFRRSLDQYVLFLPGEPASLPVLTRCINPADKILAKYGSSEHVYDVLLALLEAGMLLHVRRCHGCSRWMMAERSDKVWCGSSSCRTKPYRKTHRRAWKLYMRDYRIGNTGEKADRDKNRAKLLKEHRRTRRRISRKRRSPHKRS